MATIYAIINQKGGVGKSTTAHAIGAGLAQKGRKVLYVDMDAQGNLSHSVRPAHTEASTIQEVLLRNASITEAIRPCDGGDLLPSSPHLAGIDTVLADVGKEFRLREALTGITPHYDAIIIDTPPALGILTINALTACTEAIIPAQADIYSLQGIAQLHDTIDVVRQYCNPALRIRGIVLTRFNPRAILSREIASMTQSTAENLNTRLFDTPIREAIAVKEAQVNQQSLFDYAPRSTAALDYAALVDELMEGDAPHGQA